MMNNIEDILKNINTEIKNVSMIQERLLSHKLHQEAINNKILNELTELDKRVNNNELHITRLKLQIEHFNTFIMDTKQDLKETIKNNSEILKHISNNNEKLKTANSSIESHRKIFFALLTLNFSIIVAIITFFINKI